MIFIDSGLWIEASSPSDSYHQQAGDWFRRLKEQGDLVGVTESVISESVGFFARKVDSKAAKTVCAHILGQRRLEVLVPSTPEFLAAGSLVEKYALSSYADALTMAVMESRGIRDVLSFDADFDKNPRLHRLH